MPIFFTLLRISLIPIFTEFGPFKEWNGNCRIRSGVISLHPVIFILHPHLRLRAEQSVINLTLTFWSAVMKGTGRYRYKPFKGNLNRLEGIIFY